MNDKIIIAFILCPPATHVWRVAESDDYLFYSQHEAQLAAEDLGSNLIEEFERPDNLEMPSPPTPTPSAVWYRFATPSEGLTSQEIGWVKEQNAYLQTV